MLSGACSGLQAFVERSKVLDREPDDVRGSDEGAGVGFDEVLDLVPDRIIKNNEFAVEVRIARILHAETVTLCEIMVVNGHRDQEAGVTCGSGRDRRRSRCEIGLILKLLNRRVEKHSKANRFNRETRRRLEPLDRTSRHEELKRPKVRYGEGNVELGAPTTEPPRPRC